MTLVSLVPALRRAVTAVQRPRRWKSLAFFTRPPMGIAVSTSEYVGLATRRAGRAGLTLAELMVCAGILGLLFALILPAVQSAREAARKVQCQSNLRQIGVALHGFESARQAFPTGGDMLLDGSGGQWPRSHAPQLYLLPYLDQGDLFASVDLLSISERTVPIFPGVNDANEAAMQTSIPIYRCPSDSGAFPGCRNNYRANIGVTAFPRGANVVRTPALPGEGAFAPVNRGLRPQHFRDGMSNTVGFSEKLGGGGDSQRFAPGRDFFFLDAVANPSVIYNSPSCESLYVEACASLVDPNPPHQADTGAFWFYGGLPDTWYNHVLTPNHPIPDCGVGGGMFTTGVMPARSLHSGGVNCLMMDGAVRFVSDSIDAAIWQAAGTRNGQELTVLD